MDSWQAAASSVTLMPRPGWAAASVSSTSAARATLCTQYRDSSPAGRLLFAIAEQHTDFLPDRQPDS
ncbi:hypothetical protein Athai_39170 [Actinocatenispora thailandica]|uniref:Uncharacterized protein n=1 Tax=Actinocatenispora thailandica TaxID=227318 RepID=A0A7R7DR89_9ACTN|nr:hypothetical protein Athai_39170 [Actinocatenispora thailandica]